MRGAGAAGEARRATGAGVGKGPREGAYAYCPRAYVIIIILLLLWARDIHSILLLVVIVLEY
jgi:hypothetical protein